MKWNIAAISAASLLALAFAIQPSFGPSETPSPALEPAAAEASSAGRPSPAPKGEAKTPGPVQQWMSQMTLQDRVGQLFVLPFYGENPSVKSKAYRDYVRKVRDLRVGGLIVVGGRTRTGAIKRADPYAMAAFVNRMQKVAKVPLLVAGDFERGASMRVDSTTKFPHLMSLGAGGDIAASRELGRLTAREARAMGVHWVFAPSADVNNNPDNPIINVRAFGENPHQVGEHVAAFISGAHSEPAHRVLVTAKHFPGHGDTDVDSHMGLPRIEFTRERLNQMELVPFRAAIASRVDAIMSAHMAVPALDASGVPATVSPKILTGLLREEMGFRGLIVTDAMDMQGITKQFGPGEAAVRAIEAGADVLLMPVRPEEAIQAVTAAVKSGRIPRKRLDESVARILSAKAQVGLHRKKLVNMEAIGDELQTVESEEFAQKLAERAVTLVRNDRDTVPVRPGASTCYVVLSESRRSTTGETFAVEIRRRVPGATVVELDPNVPQAVIERTVETASSCDSTVVAAFISVGAYRGNVALPGNYPRLMDRLVRSKSPVTLIAFGNPYLLRSYPEVAGYVATYSTVPASEIAAARALFGEIDIRGRLPVSIPGLARYGDGISLPRTATTPESAAAPGDLESHGVN